MTFMNRFDIQYAVERYSSQSNPILSKAATFLLAFQEEVDSHSDGWTSWPHPSRAAKRLQELLSRPQDFSVTLDQAELKAAYKRSLAPIRAFMTRRGTAAGMTMPPTGIII